MLATVREAATLTKAHPYAIRSLRQGMSALQKCLQGPALVTDLVAILERLEKDAAEAGEEDSFLRHFERHLATLRRRVGQAVESGALRPAQAAAVSEALAALDAKGRGRLTAADCARLYDEVSATEQVVERLAQGGPARRLTRGMSIRG